ncbi:MAG: hypothetical protein AB7K86_01105 [Rhodospirillales bacterium]
MRLAALLALVLLLAGCAGDSLERNAARGFESWCRGAHNCTVSEPSR